MTTSKQSGQPPRSIFDYQWFREGRTTRSTTVQETVAASSAGSSDGATLVCKYATTANITLSGAQSPDGAAAANGDYVLVKNQTTQTQNGPYEVNTSGAWERVDTTVRAGMLVSIVAGTANEGHVFVCTNDTDPTVGTDNVAFVDVDKIDGTGTANRVAKWTATTTIGDSQIFDNGTYVSIPSGSASALGRLEVFETGTARSTVYAYNGASSTTKYALEAVSLSDAGYAAHISTTNGASGLKISTLGGANGIDISSATGSGLSSVPTDNGIAINASRNVASASVAIVDVFEDNATSTGTTIDVDNEGLGRSLHVKRNNVSATNPVVEILQDAGTGNQGALKITNDSSGAGYGVSATVTGGIGVAVIGGTVEAGYFYRPSTVTGTAPTFVIWNDSATDAQDLVYLRQDGTGNILELTKTGTSILTVNNAGTLIAKEGLHLANVRTLTTSPTTLDATDCIVLVDTSAVTHTVTLPAVADGKVAVIKDSTGNAATRNITINRGGTSTIDGATSKTIATNYGALTFVSNGTNWFLI